MRFLLLSLLLLPSALLLAEEIPDVAAEKIAAHTYVIHGPRETPTRQNHGFINNPGFVITARGVVVIDPGSSLYTGRMVLRQIRLLTDQPVTHILNTHIHGDHWLGNQAFTEVFPEVKLLAHPQMIAEAHAGAATTWVSTMNRLTEGATSGTRAVIPTQPIDDSGGFSVGGMHFRIFAPRRAHSGTDIMVQVVEDSVLFTGDNAFYERIGRMDDGSFQGSIAACDVAIKLNMKVYVPGHGHSGDASRVKVFRRYLQTLYAEVARLYDQGLSDYEMKPRVVASLKDYHQWSGFEGEVGKHINLAMLEYEKAQF